VIAFAAAAALWLVDRRLGALAVPAALAMAASRVWIGVHYPHDVALGALVGIALAAGRSSRTSAFSAMSTPYTTASTS
ncbi:phosphatase PAP2 family protein, partial [Streptomyces alboverticillatus]|uniref:phosphatase PAP2 family protein n=1 Tax=Streptomyces alboverticillatus TaxID=173770 RepID=UPI001FE50FC1